MAHAEALLRWRRSNGELALPSTFIQIAEESGLIVEIGDWVWSEAIAFLGSLKAKPDFALAINVSASQFNSNQHSAAAWLDVLKQYHVSAESVVLEITERMMLNQSQRVMRKIAMLQEAGCNFSVDDFGTGYSSLRYLKKLPIDQLKIDQSFVRDITDNQQDRAIVRTIIAMASNLSVDCIAEGVESEEEYRLLRVDGCQFFQGHLFGSAQPLAMFEAALVGQVS